MPIAPSSSNSCDDRGRASDPRRAQRRPDRRSMAAAAGGAVRSADCRRRVELVEAGLESRAPISPGVGSPACTRRRIGDVQPAWRRRSLRTARAGALRHLRRVDLGATACPCRTGARRRRRRGDLSPKRAPSSSASSNGWIRPSRLTMRLASLVAMISRRSRWLGDRVAMPAPASRAGKAASSSASSVGSSASSPCLDRVLQRQLGGRQQHREFGPGQALAVLRAAQQLLVARQPLDRAVELAAAPRASRSART